MQSSSMHQPRTALGSEPEAPMLHLSIPDIFQNCMRCRCWARGKVTTGEMAPAARSEARRITSPGKPAAH